MSRKIAVIGAEGSAALSLLAHMDVAELVLVAAGARTVADEVADAVTHEGSRRRVEGSEALEGAQGAVVVLLARRANDDELRELSRSAPGAVLIVAAGDVADECQRALDVTAFARPRVIGVASAAGLAEGSAELAAAVVLDRGHVLRCVARCQGEGGLQGAHGVRARVGAGGVSEILAEPRAEGCL